MNRTKLLWAGAGMIAVAASNAPYMRAQSAPAPKFDVTSIRPCESTLTAAGVRGGGIGVSPGRLRVNCVSVRFMIQLAYGISADSKLVFPFDPSGLAPVEGGPAWMKSDQYDIEAKAEGDPGRQAMEGPMFRALLEDRFKLKLSIETRQIPMYELIMAKSGSKLQPLQEGSCTPLDQPPSPSPGDKNPFSAFSKACGLIRIGKAAAGTFAMDFHGMSMDGIARELTRRLDRPVINKTGIAGLVDLHIEFTPDEATPGIAPGTALADDPPGGPSIFTAMQEQIGLKLEPVKGPGTFLVVDSVERPSEN
jgi:uncharacterized protein (TIGR03435 family)